MIKEDIEKDLHEEKGRREERKGDRDRKRKKEEARIIQIERYERERKEELYNIYFKRLRMI